MSANRAACPATCTRKVPSDASAVTSRRASTFSVEISVIGTGISVVFPSAETSEAACAFASKPLNGGAASSEPPRRAIVVSTARTACRKRGSSVAGDAPLTRTTASGGSRGAGPDSAVRDSCASSSAPSTRASNPSGAAPGTARWSSAMRLPVSTSSRLKHHRPAMLGDVVRRSVLPTTPDHPEPGAREDAHRVGVRAASVHRPPVDVGGPRGCVAGVIGEVHHGLAQLLVTGPPEVHRAVLAGGAGDRRSAGKGDQRLRVGEALAHISDLGEQRRGSHAAAGPGKTREDRGVGVDLEPLHHLSLELPGPALAGLDRIDQGKDAGRPGLVLLGSKARRGGLAGPPA